MSTQSVWSIKRRSHSELRRRHLLLRIAGVLLITMAMGAVSSLSNFADAAVQDAPYSCSGPADGGSYDGWGACEWAVHNAYEPPRFSDDDCTWFVSQALWQGGLPKSDTWTSASFNPGILSVQKPGSDKGPFAFPGPTVTATAAQHLVDYLTSHHLATKTPIDWSDNTAGGAKIGDVIAYYWNSGEKEGTIDHLAMVTGFSGTYPLVSQHTPGQLNRGWSWSLKNNNWIQYTSAIKDPKAYLIHITG